jgi:hypothetical protein
LIEGKRSFVDAGGQRLALDVLHHDVPGDILISDVVEHADVRMIQRSHDAPLTLESRAQSCALWDMFGQDLDGDDAIEPGSRAYRLLPYLPLRWGDRTS